MKSNIQPLWWQQLFVLFCLSAPAIETMKATTVTEDKPAISPNAAGKVS